jgi:hypothetical protein
MPKLLIYFLFHRKQKVENDQKNENISARFLCDARYIAEVKQREACAVLGWVTGLL